MKRVYMAAIGVLVAVLAAGCGSSASLTPTGPSPAGGGFGSGASITGTVNNTAPTSPAEASGAMKLGSTLTVTVAGTSVSAPVDSSGQFVLSNVPNGDVVLQFSGSGVDARVTISGVTTGDQIHVSVLVGGNNAVVTHQDRVKSNHGSEIEGLITAINAGARTLTVDGKTVSVPTTASIRHGNRTVAFADLKVGQRVHVKAAPDSTNTLVATDVMLQDDGMGDDDNEQELKGTVSGLTGTCPTISFTVGTTAVTANAATDYRGGACADVKNGNAVEVDAMKPASGPVVATRISIESGDNTQDLKGTVSGLTGTCPAISFTVATVSVTANTATTYKGGTCADVKAGSTVEVEATKPASGTAVATKISIEKS